jgi:hypothetical protein
MCLWCQVEERVYLSYEDQERKALEEIRRIQEECPGEEASAEDCPDRLRCLWEKKLEYVIARMQKERLAVEVSGSEACDPEVSRRRRGRPVRKLPGPGVPHHLLGAFERYIETMFNRLTREKDPAPASRKRSRTLIPFEGPGDPSH